MASKRKSDAIDLVPSVPEITTLDEHVDDPKENTPVKKKVARTSDTKDVKDAISKTKKGKEPAAPKDWKDIVLEGEEEDDLPIYDDCNEIRRKIRLLQKTPGWKVTHWLKEIGGINSNSYQRFMSTKGAHGGAENGTYIAAYKYFEKVRIAEGKKKTAKRIRNEEEFPHGMPLRDGNRKQWVIVAA